MIKKIFFRLFRWIPAVKNWEQDGRVDRLLKEAYRLRTPTQQELEDRAEEFTKGLPYITFKQ